MFSSEEAVVDVLGKGQLETDCGQFVLIVARLAIFLVALQLIPQLPVFLLQQSIVLFCQMLPMLHVRHFATSVLQLALILESQLFLPLAMDAL
jgi:hypothetical protein